MGTLKAYSNLLSMLEKTIGPRVESGIMRLCHRGEGWSVVVLDDEYKSVTHFDDTGAAYWLVDIEDDRMATYFKLRYL